MYNHKIVDVVTGEEVNQPISEEIIKEIEANKKLYEERANTQKNKEMLRQKALSKLIDLGLTEEEIAAL